MDPIAQIAQKMLSERARNPLQNQQVPEADPPPYAASEADSDSDSEDDRDDASIQPLKLTINAAHSIHGSNNLAPTSPAPLADATKFSTLLLHAVNQINNAAALGPRRAMKVDLTINCGITVVGDRNVVGAVGLRPKGGAGVAEAGAIVDAKRKADEDAGEEPESKKVAVDTSSP